MKILLWTTHYLPYIGGLENLVHALALQLQKAGHQVMVISNAEKFAKLSIEGVQVYNFPFMKTLSCFHLQGIKKILSEIQQILEEFSPDIVNVHGWFECFCFYQNRALAKTKIPLCITIHGLLEQKYYQTEECVKLWSMARGVNTVSRALIESLEEQKYSHPFLRVIHNGLEIPVDPIVPLSLTAPQLLMVGRLTDEKGFDVAFHAMKIVSKVRPEVKLRLVGGGDLYHHLLQLKHQLQLDPWIEMTDFIPPPKVRRYIDEASLILVPSSYESFSLVALEAALRARPVIASNVYGLKEVIAADRTGILIEPKNHEALARAILSLLETPAKMRQMGEEAYRRATQLFSIETTAKKYLEMYHQFL